MDALPDLIKPRSGLLLADVVRLLVGGCGAGGLGDPGGLHLEPAASHSKYDRTTIRAGLPSALDADRSAPPSQFWRTR